MPEEIIVDSFFIWPLTTGAFIIAYVNLVANLISFLMILSMSLIAFNSSLYPSICVTDPGFTHTQISVMKIAFPMLVIFEGLETYISVLLVVGLHLDDPFKVYIWILYNELALSLKFILCLHRAITTLIFQGDFTGVIDLVVALIAHGFQIYTILVVNSYYMKLKEPKRFHFK